MSVYNDFKKFVTDVEASSTYKTWCNQHSSDCAAWQTYRTALLTNPLPPPPPPMTTRFGSALVDVGIMAVHAGLIVPPPLPPLTASFKFSISPTSSETVLFTDSSTPGPSGPITSWLWDFGDGTTSTVENPSHLYAVAGTYSVTLTITGTDPDATSSVTLPVQVTNSLAANFAVSLSGLTATFTDESVPGPHGPITAWAWNFGDGNTSTAQNPSHTYAAAGTYTVTLTVTGTAPDGTDNTSQPISPSAAVTPGSPAFHGPWYATNSPWRTPIPAGWASYVHPDTPSMVQGVWTNGSPIQIHAFAYRQAEMQAKYGSIGSTYMKWCGPGGQENVIYAPNGTPTITVWEDFPSYKAKSYQVPMPLGWTGYSEPTKNAPTYYERRTTVVCENGDLFYLAHVTPPGHPIAGFPSNTDTDWHAQRVVKDVHGGWLGQNPAWDGGGSGFPFFAGLITPFDILNTPVGGNYGHVIACNGTWNASGAYTSHPKKVYPTPWSVWGIKPNTDGLVPDVVGSPYGARIFLNPSLTDTNLRSLGITKEWQLQIARTLQRYGLYSKEQSISQGAAGQLLAESVESIAWNKAHGFYPSNFVYPWISDGTTDNADGDSTTYNAALAADALPVAASDWKVWNWNPPYYSGISGP